MQNTFAAEKTALLAILLAASQAERDGNADAARTLNEMLVVSAAELETAIVLAAGEAPTAALN